MKTAPLQTDQIGRLLEQLGQALSTGDLHKASACWAVPALILSDDGATAVIDTSEIEAFFEQAAEWYHLQGIASTRPEIERIDMLSGTLAAVDVRWPSLDASGREKASERSHYIVQLDDDGEVHIRVALARSGKAPQ